MSIESPAGARATPRRARFLRAGVIAAAAIFAATGAVGASAAPAPSASPAPVPTGTLPPLPPPPAQDQAAVIAGAAYAAKAEFAFAIPVQFQRVYATYNVVIGPNTFTTDSAAYVLQAPGPDPVYGVFPDVRKTILGFGAIPVTATIRLSQIVDANGVLQPIIVHNESVSAPDGSASGPSTVKGQVQIQLLDVEVDQVPVDVGDNCRGSVPIDLVLDGVDLPGDNADDYSPAGGGPLSGTFTIPTFSGCGTGGQDLDPLFDGTVSGPDNILSLYQGPLGEWDPTSRYDCRQQANGRPCKIPAPITPLPSPSGG